MVFDYSRLRGKIIEVYGSQAKFSHDMQLSEHSLSLKLAGKNSWKQKEMQRACDLLGVPYEEIPKYFFTVIVQSV